MQYQNQTSLQTHWFLYCISCNQLSNSLQMEKNPYNHTNSRKKWFSKRVTCLRGGNGQTDSKSKFMVSIVLLGRRQKYLHIHFPSLRVLLTTFFSLLHCPQSFIGQGSTFLSILKFIFVQKLLLHGPFFFNLYLKYEEF